MLRKDFNPNTSRRSATSVHRCIAKLATRVWDVRKFNIKTQMFETVEYGGYKANRWKLRPISSNNSLTSDAP